MSRVESRARAIAASPGVTNRSRMWLTGGLLLGVLALGACSSTPAVEDLDLTQLEPPEALVAREAEELNACMAEAGYSDFRSPPMSVSASMGDLVPLEETVASILRQVNSPAETVYVPKYIDEHGLSGEAVTVFSDAFLACDDARVANRLGDSDSARGSALAVLSRALRDLHESPEYITALRDYVSCMRADGWNVQDNGAADGPILAVLFESVVEPGSGESGLAGAVLDPAGVTAAEEVQTQLVASDIRCGADTLEPVYVPFNEKYGALAAALSGLRPDGVNRVRL